MAHGNERVAITSCKSRYTTRGQHHTTSDAGLTLENNKRVDVIIGDLYDNHD